MTILLVFGDVWCLLDPVASVLGVQGLNLTLILKKKVTKGH